MAYGVTTEGFVIKPQSVIRSEVDSYERMNVDAGLTLIDKSGFGSLNVAVCEQCAELWELGQAVYSATYPRSANGWSLDEACSLSNTYRDGNSKSIGTAQVTLNPDKSLPAGSVAHPLNRPNDRFISKTTVPADPAGGTFDVEFEAETAGAIVVTAGQLTEIAEPVSGWTAVNNTAAFSTGDAREEDDELRDKQANQLEAGGSTNVDAIRAGLLTLEGVLDAVVFENVKGIVQDGLKPHSIWAVVRGGTSSEISAKLFEKKGAGIDTNGVQQNDVTDSKGHDHTMEHDWATALTFYAAFTIETDDTYDAVQGPIDIKANCAEYVNDRGIGTEVKYDFCKSAAYHVQGVTEVTDLKIGFSSPPTGTGNLAVGDTQYAQSDVANISVS